MLLRILLGLYYFLENFNLPTIQYQLSLLILWVAFEAPKLAWLTPLPLILSLVFMGLLSKYWNRLTPSQRISLIVIILVLFTIIETFGISF